MATEPMGMAVEEDLDRYEATLRAAGFRRIAGADEVGRGALAGPLVAAAVVLPDDFDRTGLRDSKLLTAKQREQQCERIVASCVFVIRKIEPNVLDLRGLHRSNLALLRRCVRAIAPTPDYVLTDGFPVSKMPCPALGVKKGDMVAASIAAASIVAKVTRDRIMRGMHRRYPEFDFAHNKGYGTPVHRAALRRLGPTPIHRLSFAGVGQPELFAYDDAAFGSA
jgi:ribonuclease HII